MELLDLHLGRPITRGALTVFPVWNGNAVASRGYRVASATLTVEERAGSAVVEELVVTNTGDRPALVLEGELIEGGQQHRVAARSVMIGPGESVVLDVRCVEAGRWSGSRGHSRTGRRAPMSVRTASHQSMTWQRIDEIAARTSTHSATRFLGDALRPVEERARALVAELRPLPFQSGLLLCIEGQPVQLEVYDSPRTLASQWQPLLQAAAIDALDRPPIPTPGRRARRFLDRVRAGASAYAHLTTLEWNGRTVHAVATNPRHPLVMA